MENPTSMLDAPNKVKSKKPNTGTAKARNDIRWEALRDEIRQLYMDEDRSLLATRKTIEEKHGFKASERKWKDTLKKWGYSKYLHAKDMKVLVQKREKRLRDEGKGTKFFHRGKPMPPERLGNFKRRKMNIEQEEVDEVATPRDITYSTPGPGPSADSSAEINAPEIDQPNINTAVTSLLNLQSGNIANQSLPPAHWRGFPIR